MTLSMHRAVKSALLAALAGWLASAPVAQAAEARHNFHRGDDALLRNRGNENTAIGDLAISPESSCFPRSSNPNSCCQGENMGYCGIDGSQCNACCSGPGQGDCGPGNTGDANAAVGFAALQWNRPGAMNTAAGAEALRYNISGTDNTAAGMQALQKNKSGIENVAVGQAALQANTIGRFNSALGASALKENTGSDGCTGSQAPQPCCSYAGAGTCGEYNTAAGFEALQKNLTGSYNSALGFGALSANTTGTDNTAAGSYALWSNVGSDGCTAAITPYACCTGMGKGTCGSYNTAIGLWALGLNNPGVENTAAGANALFFNSRGNYNSAVGSEALYGNRYGSNNTAIGQRALASFSIPADNTAVGARSLNPNSLCKAPGMPLDCCSAEGQGTCGGGSSNNIAVGAGAGLNMATGSNNIYIGNPAPGIEFNTIRIGVQQPAGGPIDTSAATATYIAGISNGMGNGTGVAVFVDNDGALSPQVSSARFKDDIEDMGDSSNGLMHLRPVRFRYNEDIDPSGLQHYGLVAEEVAKIYPDLVVYDNQGRPQAVRYHLVYAMMLNELQRRERKIESLSAEVQPLKAQAREISDLRARIAHLETLVSARLKPLGPASETAAPQL